MNTDNAEAPRGLLAVVDPNKRLEKRDPSTTMAVPMEHSKETLLMKHFEVCCNCCRAVLQAALCHNSAGSYDIPGWSSGITVAGDYACVVAGEYVGPEIISTRIR